MERGDDRLLDDPFPVARRLIDAPATFCGEPPSFFNRAAQPAANVRHFHSLIVPHSASPRSAVSVNSTTPNSTTPNSTTPIPQLPTPNSTNPNSQSCVGRCLGVASFGRYWELWSCGVVE